MRCRPSPLMLKRAEVFLLTLVLSMVGSPSGRRFLAAHPFYDDLAVSAYIAFRAADKQNPTLPGQPG